MPLFDPFFKAATGYAAYDYQRRLACGERDGRTEQEWLGSGARCESRLIDIPTGLGKTAAVVLAWLWNRVALGDESWPRRLVYCLPMRTLVEQTRDEVARWISTLLDAATAGKLPLTAETIQRFQWLKDHSPVILMGGEDAGEWDIHPEADAILIGTQDMLLSRALNRGYGMSRYRWPMHFGLLNNDCLWVMDETQLMGAGLSTACQLEAFRRSSQQDFGSFGKADSVTWYMSATNNPDLLRTREWRDFPRPETFRIDLKEEKAATSGEIHRRRNAEKRLELRPGSNFGAAVAVNALAKAIIAEHGEMIAKIGGDARLPTRTLIICNTVDRAIAVYQELDAQKPGGCDLLLLHSRFRPPERSKQMKRLRATSCRGFLRSFPKGQIVVATQVIEAGVDVSSGILYSEIAPLASLVQRLGRLNRAGEFNGSKWKPRAVIVGLGFVATPEREKEEARKKREKENAACSLPYEVAQCTEAPKTLERLNDNASPAAFEQPQIRDAVAASISRCPYSLQRHELLDFFDTDANLSLGFTDVSPFVRGLDDDTDIQVCWRESWPQEDGANGTGKPDFTPDFQRDELCAVPIGKALKARGILNHGWIWRGMQSGWFSVNDAGLSPGMTVLLPLAAGGYDNLIGWTGNKDDNKHSAHYEPREGLRDEEQLSCLDNGWRSIADHTAEVHNELVELLRHLLLGSEPERAALLGAVPWHDVGKNYAAWQDAVATALQKANITGKDAYRPFAKFSLSESPSIRSLTGRELRKEIARLKRMFRPGVAHEVASALAFRQAEQVRLGPARDTDLASLLSEYVIMSHHGHVRKVLRDEIPRFPSDVYDTESVRGIVHGSALPPVTIDDQPLGCDSLSTDCRRMGRDASGHESYTRAILRLLGYYGPFRLAYFEALFRAADIRASKLAVAPADSNTSGRDLAREHPSVADPSGAAQASDAPASDSAGRGPEHGVRARAGVGGDGSRDTRPGNATRFIETTRGVLSYAQLAPLLAERVALTELALYDDEAFAGVPLDESLFLDLHRRLCGDLVPAWAGRWRDISVTVGRLSPPPPFQVPMQMRDYTLDLQARWHEAVSGPPERLVELLAFAEGRFLSIHPFQDFNGRAVRVFLLELLRRLDLPRVELAPQTDAGRAQYFAALEAADRKEWGLLVAIWQARLTP